MKKKLINKVLVMLLILVFSIGMFLPINVQATDSINTISTEDNTERSIATGITEISSEQDLKKMENSTTDDCFYLKNDIDITGNWNPISNFKGIFDGNGHTITFNIDESTGPIPSVQFLGLFGYCTNATIKNLNVEGNISLTTGGSLFNPNVYIGGIVASSTNSTLYNVHFSGNINIKTNNDNSSWVGGLIGKSDNTEISLSSNSATITTVVNSIIGVTKTGGLCGEFSGNIENCYNLGNVTSTAISESPYAGGLVGYNKGSISKSYNAGTVKSEGSGLSLSDVYAGGITAFGETESSVSDCAVMSQEISVTIGYINKGYNYIIANGGNKSDNVSINNIAGSPTNDSNSQYTQDQFKTTTPYQHFDFFNTWVIDENINNGYPIQDKNIFAYFTYSDVPDELQWFINNDYITYEDLKKTSDGFTLCTKPLSEILSNMGIIEINGYDEGEVYEDEDLEDWYIFSVDNVGQTYGILKMRYDIEKNNIGTAIPFLDFDISLIKSFYEDLNQQVADSEYEKELYEELDILINGILDSDYHFSYIIADYFSTVNCKANYLIAEEYIRKIVYMDRDSNGYIKVPNGLSNKQSNFLESIPEIYDEENSRIKVKKYNLSNTEKCAILACRTGNVSLNNYAAENIAHAAATKYLGIFLQGTDETLETPGGTITRLTAEELMRHFIKSDAGVGEETFIKEPFINNIAIQLEKIYGAI